MFLVRQVRRPFAYILSISPPHSARGVPPTMQVRYQCRRHASCRMQHIKLTRLNILCSAAPSSANKIVSAHHGEYKSLILLRLS